MQDRPTRRTIASGLMLAGLAGAVPMPARGQARAGSGSSEIKFGHTTAYSGPASSYGVIGKTQAAYFQKLNDEGGINGRKLTFVSYDDGYNPAKTVEQIRRLVESDEVLFTFQTLGTAPNAAIMKYMNAKKVPQLFVSTGASKFSDPKAYPWTIGWNPTYLTEGRIYGRYILANHPSARIAILSQNDDFGREVIVGLKEGLGARAAGMIIAESTYEVTDPTVDSQMLKLRASGADLFMDITTPKFASQAIRKAGELGWKPVHILSVNSVSVGQVLRPAGLDYAQDVLSVAYLKDYVDPQWKDDAGMNEWISFMDKYMPEADKNNSVYAYGYATAQTLEHVLRQVGDDLSRENIMRQATSLKSVQLGMFLPGISVSTSPTDYLVIEQMRMMRFKGDRWQPFGDLIDTQNRGG